MQITITCELNTSECVHILRVYAHKQYQSFKKAGTNRPKRLVIGNSLKNVNTLKPISNFHISYLPLHCSWETFMYISYIICNVLVWNIVSYVFYIKNYGEKWMKLFHKFHKISWDLKWREHIPSISQFLSWHSVWLCQ